MLISSAHNGKDIVSKTMSE